MTPEQLKVHRELEFLRACARASSRGRGDLGARRKQAEVRMKKLQQIRKGSRGRPR